MSNGNIIDPVDWEFLTRAAAESDRKRAIVEAERQRMRARADQWQPQRRMFSGMDCLPGQEDLFEENR